MLVSRRGHKFITGIKNMETLSIRANDPGVNNKKMSWKGRVGPRQKPRRRLPRWMRRARKRAQRGPTTSPDTADTSTPSSATPPESLFRTSAALSWLRKQLHSTEDPILADRTLGVCRLDPWVRTLGTRVRNYRSGIDRCRLLLPFSQSYAVTIRYIAATRDGLMGPIGIMSYKMRRLLTQWCANTRPCVSWSRVDKKKGGLSSILKIWELTEMLGRRGSTLPARNCEKDSPRRVCPLGRNSLLQSRSRFRPPLQNKPSSFYLHMSYVKTMRLLSG